MALYSIKEYAILNVKINNTSRKHRELAISVMQLVTFVMVPLLLNVSNVMMDTFIAEVRVHQGAPNYSSSITEYVQVVLKNV